MASIKISIAAVEQWAARDEERWRQFVGCVFWHESLGAMPLIELNWPKSLIFKDGSEKAVFAIEHAYFFEHVDFVGRGSNAKQVTHELQEEDARQVQIAEARRRKEEEEEARLVEIRRREEEEQRIAAEEAERRAKEKKLLEDRLTDALDRDYLNAGRFYKEELSERLAPAEYGKIKTRFLQDWITENSKSDQGAAVEDLEQAAAVGSADYHTLVSARAGSGKTATLINRALFLHKHCGVGANEILMLAFNRDAAQEMRDRLENAAGV